MSCVSSDGTSSLCVYLTPYLSFLGTSFSNRPYIARIARSRIDDGRV